MYDIETCEDADSGVLSPVLCVLMYSKEEPIRFWTGQDEFGRPDDDEQQRCCVTKMVEYVIAQCNADRSKKIVLLAHNASRLLSFGRASICFIHRLHTLAGLMPNSCSKAL